MIEKCLNFNIEKKRGDVVALLFKINMKIMI